jgi:hypothetical protein
MIERKWLSKSSYHLDWSLRRALWLSFRLRQLEKKKKNREIFFVVFFFSSRILSSIEAKRKSRDNSRWSFFRNLINFFVLFVDRIVLFLIRIFAFWRFFVSFLTRLTRIVCRTSIVFFCQCCRLSWIFVVVYQSDIVLRKIWQCLVCCVDDCLICCVFVAVDCYRLRSSFFVVRRSHFNRHKKANLFTCFKHLKQKRKNCRKSLRMHRFEKVNEWNRRSWQHQKFTKNQIAIEWNVLFEWRNVSKSHKSTKIHLWNVVHDRCCRYESSVIRLF